MLARQRLPQMSGAASPMWCPRATASAPLPRRSGVHPPPAAPLVTRLPHPRTCRRLDTTKVAAAAAAADPSGVPDSGSDWRGSAPTLGTALKQQWRRARSAFVSEYDAELFSLAIPALASMLLDPIMNVISASMIGHLGTQQMAAVSLGSLAVSFATFTFGFLVFLTTPKVAAAHVLGDKARVSRHAAVGLWLALACGLAVTGGLVAFSDSVISVLKPPEPQVAIYASQFIRIRAWGILSALVSFVAAGTYRGVKDTVTPLQAAVVATGSNFILSVTLIYGLKLGVAGAALAATSASWVSAGMLVWLLFKKKLLRPADAARRPAWEEVQPYVSQGFFLAFRMVATFGIIMYASAMCVRLGAASQAAFEVIRQLWILSIQLFECLNVATQSMAAGLLGSGDRAAARALLRRATGLSVAVGAGVGAALLVAQVPLVSIFTSDAVVAQMSLAIIPMIAVGMPIDAGASIADGGFIAAGRTNTLSAIQVCGSAAQFAVLSWAAAAGMASTMTTWGVLKLMSVFRFAGGAYMHFYSSDSAYLPHNAGSDATSSSSSSSDSSDSTAGSADGLEGPVSATVDEEERELWRQQLWAEASQDVNGFGPPDLGPQHMSAAEMQQYHEQQQELQQQQPLMHEHEQYVTGGGGGGDEAAAQLRRRARMLDPSAKVEQPVLASWEVPPVGPSHSA